MKHISPRIVLATLGLMSVSVGFAVHAATRYAEIADGDEISVRRPADMDYDPFAIRPSRKPRDERPESDSSPPRKASTRSGGNSYADPKQFIMPAASNDNGIVRLPTVRPDVDPANGSTSESSQNTAENATERRSESSQLPAVRIPVAGNSSNLDRTVSFDMPAARGGDSAYQTSTGSSAQDDDIPIISASEAGPRPAVFAERQTPTSQAETSPWSANSNQENSHAPLTIDSSEAGSAFDRESVEAFPPVISSAPVPGNARGNASPSTAMPRQVAVSPVPTTREPANSDSSEAWHTTANPLVATGNRTANAAGTNNVANAGSMHVNPNRRIEVGNSVADRQFQQTGYGQAEVPPVTQTRVDAPIVAYEPIHQSSEQPRNEIVHLTEALQFPDTPSNRRGTTPLEQLTQASLTADPSSQFPINTVSQDGVPSTAGPGTPTLPYDNSFSLMPDGMPSIQDELNEGIYEPGFYGAPCPGGCPSKFYAMADIIFYLPKMSEFSLSSAISTDQDFYRGGARATFGYRGDCLVGWEASVMYLPSATEILSSQNQTVAGQLGIRFIPEGGFTNVNLTSFGQPNGLVHIQDHRTEFGTFEVNRTTWGWDVLNTSFGFRLTHFQDEVRLGGGPTALPLEQMPGLFRHNVDNFLIGPQIGLTLIDDSRDLLTFDFRGKLGGYVNLIEGDTQFVNEGITYIDRNNIQESTLAGSIDISTGIALRITRNIHVRAGIDAMYYYGVATASEQLINSVVPGGVRLTPATGSKVQDEDDLFYFGGTVGIYGNWP